MAELLANTVSATAISTPDNNGSTPLHYAAHSGQETVLEMLLDHGADIDAVDKVAPPPCLACRCCEPQLDVRA